MTKTITNRCCCCGGEVLASYTEGDEVGKAFAEACDVCVECHKADCQVLTGKKCNVTGKKMAKTMQNEVIKSKQFLPAGTKG